MERAGNILSAIFDSSDDVWFFVLPDFSIRFFNHKAAENAKVLHRREIKEGDSILDFARDAKNNLSESFKKSFSEALSGKVIKIEDHVQYESLSAWTRTKYTPVYEGADLLGVSVLVEDITAEKEFEELRQRQQEEILELSNKREEFVNIASHELKTPLTSLKASLQIISKKIEQGGSYQDVKRFLEKSNISVIKLNNLIRSLLDANRITNGALILEKTTFGMAALIDDCCDHVRMEGKHVIRIEGVLDLEVFADREKIDQVVTNLINNAAKYAASSPEILVTIQHEPEFAKVSIRDFGPGIPQEKFEKLFKKYYQAESGHQSGMGLGLYIAEGIIKQHGGEMGVSSELEKGSLFWFTLPLSLDI